MRRGSSVLCRLSTCTRLKNTPSLFSYVGYGSKVVGCRFVSTTPTTEKNPSYTIGVLPGDGIGPDIVNSALEVLEAAMRKVNQNADRFSELRVAWSTFPIGWAGIRHPSHKHPISDTVKAQLKKCNAWIMGPHDSSSYPPEWKHIRNPSGELRHHFELYANVRPTRSYPNVPALSHPDTDLVIVRENSQGFYADRNMYQGSGEFMPTKDVALVCGVFTRAAAKRIAKVAFDLALKRKQPNALQRVTVVHKANVLPLTTGILLEECEKLTQEEKYKGVKLDGYHIDAMCAHLVRRGNEFDVIVTENMFGDILSDLAGELCGSLGLAGSLNFNEDRAMAQATHGAAPDIAPLKIGNPVGMISSAAMLAEWLGNKHSDERWNKVGQLMNAAVEKTLTEEGHMEKLTPDIGGSGKTADFTAEIVSVLKEL